MLKMHIEDLQYLVCQRKERSVQVNWHINDEKMTDRTNFLGNGIHIKIMNQDSGRKDIMDAVKNLACKNAVKIDIDEFSELLFKKYKFPEPDMGIICSKLFIFLNYPVWQLRLTELYKLNSLNSITLPIFLDLLERFSKCEQRLGV